MTQKAIVMHGRDHEHGGADPTRIAYEDVGTSGGGGSGGGIQFETYPQAGQWLYAQTNGPATSPSGYGIELYDDSANGIGIATDGGGDMTLNVTGGGTLHLSGADGITIEDSGSTSSVILRSTNNNVNISAHNKLTLSAGLSNVEISSTGIVRVRLNSSTEKLQVVDASLNPLLEVRGDATFHILSGASWVADL